MCFVMIGHPSSPESTSSVECLVSKQPKCEENAQGFPCISSASSRYSALLHLLVHSISTTPLAWNSQIFTSCQLRPGQSWQLLLMKNVMFCPACPLAIVSHLGIQLLCLTLPSGFNHNSSRKFSIVS